MITFTGLQQALDEYGERTSTDTEDVDRKIAAMRVAMQVLAILRGIGADDIDAEIEEALLRPVPVDRHGEWFVTHPQMLRTAFVCDLADENELFQATFSALRGTATKARISACVAMSPRWEDGELFEDEPVGVSFFAPANVPSIVMVVSRAGNLRTMELRGELSNTQKRILDKLHGVLAGGEPDGSVEESDKACAHAAMWDALNVAEVNQRFYAGIAARFNELVKALVAAGHDEGDAKMFASRLIGRILFVWFLNQKEFINPDEHYLEIGDLDSTEYYEQKLKRLFFATLNTAKNRRGEDGDKLTPFLNGGLFEEQATDFPNESIPFPEGFFARLYEHFGQYDFTTDESTPDYEQVAIDPEMLGRIFESLLAEQMDDTGKIARNAKGAFYTPREIVAYMCREALRQYLYRELGNDNGIHQGIDKLLDTSDGKWESDSAPRKILWNSNTSIVLPQAIAALERVRVLDPACGSGAFPMGMLQLLMRCRVRLMGKAATANSYQQKLEILQNNVFGVDIEPMAVEIARLRVWLSMIVERESIGQVEPLPNLDFKFVCADSLVPLANEDVSGTDQVRDMTIANVSLKKGILNQGAFDLADESELLEQLKKIRSRYFATTDSERKSELMHQFEEISNQLGGGVASSRGRQIADFHPHSSTVSETGHAPFFDPDLMFGTDAFDVVIGNPPYVQLQKMKNQRIAYESLGYRSYNKTGDLYELFYERGLELLSGHGVLNYITSNKWMRNRYGKELREYLARNAEVISLIDLGAGRFSSATVDTNIMLLAKGHSDRVLQAVKYADDSLTDIAAYVEKYATTIPFNLVKGNTVSDVNKKMPDGGPWVILTDMERDIKAKMEEVGTPLKQLDVRINYGVKTGLNDAFIIDKAKRDELIAADPKSAEIIRPVLRGRDIKRYHYEFADQYLITTHNGYKSEGIDIPRIDVNKYPATKEWLSSFEPKLSKRADQGNTPYNLRDCAYMGDFSQPKIVWGEISDRAKFAFDKEGQFIAPNSVFMLLGSSLPELTAYLNSDLAEYAFSTMGTTTGMGTVRWQKQKVELIPVPQFNSQVREALKSLIVQIGTWSSSDQKWKDCRQAINDCIFSSVGLDDKERDFIRQQVK
ncbi:Eco57I restriction-modification methylase domain-containing protein [Bifidobacterium sp. M3-N-101]|uniref:Eco57I restriction-modification methylase domain-containing protein n=1 Tax=Bifidobacterium TaxID=1678 RepID=UPI00202FA10C|nr:MULTISPECIES: Eco57I restriction-modification methylase domain-containing protein [Bifidobacterium]MCM0690183.1 Eco57I restriction-modification methylase domain-containing protein [Bifidobacterium sp. M3-N-101]WPT10450.1 Eco57I restriction-modification methylase domain-containing protein [Bifidobacterium breve]